MLRSNTSPLRILKKQQKQFSTSNFKNSICNVIKTPKKKNPQNSNSEELIKTYLRIRPIENAKDSYCKILNEKEIEVLAPEDSNAFKNGKQGPEQYIFHKVFPQEATQEQIYENIALPLIKKFLIDKINCLIFATGVTSSGKTYTVEGNEESPGLLRNILATIINSLKESEVKRLNLIPLRYDEFKEDTTSIKEDSDVLISKNEKPFPYIKVNDIIKVDPKYSYSLWASYYEIYNEQIYDLINKSEKRSLSIKIDQNKNSYVKDLKNVSINSYEDCDNILKQGKANRRKFSTKLNQSSSRSHSIFTLRLLCQNKEENDVFVTRFTIVDLAGSERANHTQSRQKQLKEAGSINKSIMILTRVFDCLRNIQKNVQYEIPPFNDSKLTTLLKPSLINGHISTIININPLPEFYDETLTVLRFSSTVKEVAPITARVDSGLQTIKRPRIIIPKSQIKKKNLNVSKNKISISQNLVNYQNQHNQHNQNQNQNQSQTPNTSQIIISTPLSNNMKEIMNRTSKLLGDGSIKIESNKSNINNENSNSVSECVLTENEICQLVDSFEEHINKLKNILIESEIYRQQREYVIRNEMMKQMELQIGHLQEYQSLDTIKENNKIIFGKLVNSQDLCQLQRDNDKLISKLKSKNMIISTLKDEIQTLESEVNKFKEQSTESNKRKINEKLKKLELISKSNELDSQRIKILQENINLMELTIKNKQKTINDLNNNITLIQDNHEFSFKKFKTKMENQFNEKKRRYEETIDDLKSQLSKLKAEKKRKSYPNNLTMKNDNQEITANLEMEMEIINDNDKNNMENTNTSSNNSNISYESTENDNTNHKSNSSPRNNSSTRSNSRRRSSSSRRRSNRNHRSNSSRRNTLSFVSYIGHDKNNNEIEIIDLEMDPNDNTENNKNNSNFSDTNNDEKFNTVEIEQNLKIEQHKESENTKNNEYKDNKNTKIDSNKNNNTKIDLNENNVNININNSENNIDMIIDTNKININEKIDINENLENNSDKNNENNKINSNETIRDLNSGSNENNENIKINSNKNKIHNSYNKENRKNNYKKATAPTKAIKPKRKRKLKKGKDAIFLESLNAL